jgi:ATP phosphoribosyltransferase
LAHAIREFVLSGAELQGDARTRFAAIQERSAELAQQFSEHVLDATDGFKLTVPTERLAGVPADVVPVSGAAEIAPHLGIADVVVDLTSTGSTLRVNGLREVDTVLRSSAHLITAEGGPRNGDPDRKQELDDLVVALASVIRARSQRYLMANVPRNALAQVREVLPGLNGPTVIEIAESSQYVAVHAVVSAATIYRTISQLRALGGEGILVTRIERLVP